MCVCALSGCLRVAGGEKKGSSSIRAEGLGCLGGEHLLGRQELLTFLYNLRCDFCFFFQSLFRHLLEEQMVVGFFVLPP